MVDYIKHILLQLYILAFVVFMLFLIKLLY